jgi:hypothetical protein
LLRRKVQIQRIKVQIPKEKGKRESLKGSNSIAQGK